MKDFIKGLFKDSKEIYQIKNSFRFVLNGIFEFLRGDSISTENSNKKFWILPDNYILIGKIFIGENNFLLFLVDKYEENSEIGIGYENGEYKTLINTKVLNFKIKKQITGVYRLRRGCGRTVYFTDNYNEPRIINIDKLDLYKTNNLWDKNKFSLFKDYNKIPIFSDIKILQNGNLLSGSYNFAIQYLDENLNPTEFITVSDTILIYKDIENSKDFSEIKGSTSFENYLNNKEGTNKSIKITLNNLDTSFSYYRIAIIKSNNGSGIINEVLFSKNINITTKSFSYYSDNNLIKGTEEEILQVKNKIEKVKNIEQLDNRLLLANLKEKDFNSCIFQRYASKIKADLELKEIYLNDINSLGNPKRPNFHNEFIGYIPGEIYAFNIHYVFEDYSYTFGYHIPGRNPKYNSLMSSDNKLKNTFYEEIKCNKHFWCKDSQGDSLLNKNVRHHRFPLRGEIDEPLFKEIPYSNNQYKLKKLYLNISGTTSLSNIFYKVIYKIENDLKEKEFLISNYQNSFQQFIDSSYENITFIEVKEKNDLEEWVSPFSGLIYNDEIITEIIKKNKKLYKTKIFGIKFSNIEVPTIKELNGKKIIGYFITRAERIDKTILDSAVLLPLLKVEDKKFSSHGHLLPNSEKLENKIFALLNPKFKFKKLEIGNVNEIIQEGYYSLEEKELGSKIIEDVQPGTSYDSSIHKHREKDSDGFSLHVFVRNNIVKYFNNNKILAKEDEVKDIFFLDTLFSKSVILDSETKEIFNLSTDNTIGILQLNKEYQVSKENIPYVILKNNLSDPYSDFQTLRYYKETDSFNLVNKKTVTLFNGDSIIGSIKYASSIFHDIRIKNRRKKSGILFYILGVAVGILGGGSLLPISLALLSIGYKIQQANKVYKDLYDKGLKETIKDNDTKIEFEGEIEDDEIQWFMDVIENLWFETDLNIPLRVGANKLKTDFLPSPSHSEKKVLLNYFIDKLTELDPKADGGRTYQGFCKPEIYYINEDFERRNKQKIFYTLPKNFDCCDRCKNEFPHRILFSEISYKEEKVDNYRVFLANNYRDIDGETGKIIDIKTIQKNLFLITETAIYHLPQNIQERVTGDIVSFIGTGEFLSLPLKKIVDSGNNLSTGTLFKEGIIKNTYGLLIPSENGIFLFSGNELKPLHLLGLNNWFKKNLKFKQYEKYLKDNNRVFPFIDNPVNKYGIGFISAYDEKNNRFILTKKDFLFEDFEIKDYELCLRKNELRIFYNFNQIIKNKEEEGYKYLGIKDCKMIFIRDISVLEEVTNTYKIPSDTDIHIFYDSSGSFGGSNSSCNNKIKDAVYYWFNSVIDDEWEGTLYEYYDFSERWIKYSEKVKNKYLTEGINDLSNKKVILISFINEAHPYYHNENFNENLCAYFPGECPTLNFQEDWDIHTDLYSDFNSFKGILYPIVFNNISQSCGGNYSFDLPSATKNFLKHSIAQILGNKPTNDYIQNNLIPKNPAFTDEEWGILLLALQEDPFPYYGYGLKDFGWNGKWDVYAPSEGDIIDKEQFKKDINSLLQNGFYEEIEEKEFCSTEFLEVSSEVIEPKIIDNSWTISFNLVNNSWTSFHSYLPNLYLFTSKDFFSYKQDKKDIYIHNVKNKYLEFYEEFKPFIIDFIDNKKPLNTKTWEYFDFKTEAIIYNEEEDSDYKIEKTFNKVIFYNSYQSSGKMKIIINDKIKDHRLFSIKNEKDTIIANKHEETWSLNNLRDFRIDYKSPIFIKNIKDLQENYYIDKILNMNSIDFNKNWTNLEKFRDKYLEIRFIYNNFENIKLIFYYTLENEEISNR